VIHKFFRHRSIVAWPLLLAFASLNFVAYRQAYTMMNFTQHGTRTEKPEELSFFQKVKILLTGVNIPKPLNDSTPKNLDLPFEVHRVKVDDQFELEGWYIPHSESNGVILLFHGYAASKSKLLPEAKAFNELGYTTFLVDFRGSGGSSGHETSIGYLEADDVARAVEYVQGISTGQPIILYGQSMGSVAILRAIYTHQVQPDAIIIEAVFDKLLSTVQNRFSAMGIPSFPGAQLLVFWGGVQNGYLGFKHNPVEYAPQVQCPVLMLHGADDPRATIEQAEAVFQKLNGEKQFERFEGVVHESYLVAKPDQWRQVVSQFLQRVAR
jgi:alpha-beta hydrolase superfamily lysophospholipase